MNNDMYNDIAEKKEIEQLTQFISQFISLVAKNLPTDIEAALEQLKDDEEKPLAKELYECIFQNLKMAKDLQRPICQDTGIVQFFIKAGTKFPYLDEIEDILKNAVLDATQRTPLRHNAVKTFSEHNTGTNCGKGVPWIEWEIIPKSSELHFDVYFAGGGCSLPGRSKVFMPADGYEGIVKYVLDTVVDWGVNACPPLIVGVGIGSCSPTAAILSKKALLRPVGTINSNSQAAELESLLKEGLNNIGIGPLGLTGKKSVMDVHVEFADHHPATLAAGISVGCWATRRGSVTINADFSYKIHSHSQNEI